MEKQHESIALRLCMAIEEMATVMKVKKSSFGKVLMSHPTHYSRYKTPEEVQQMIQQYEIQIAASGENERGVSLMREAVKRLKLLVEDE
jgi:hypothetical protein